MDDKNTTSELHKNEIELMLLQLIFETSLDELEFLKSIINLNKECYDFDTYDEINKFYIKTKNFLLKFANGLSENCIEEVLESEIKHLEQLHNEEINKEIEEEKTTSENIKRQEEINEFKRNSYFEYYAGNRCVGSTIDELQNLIKENQVKEKYVEKYLQAQVDQELYKLSQKESQLNEIISEFDKKSEFEQKIHTESENFHSECIGDLLKLLNEWMEHYDKRCAELDSKIKSNEAKINEQKQEISDKRNLFKSRKEAIEAWDDLKEKRRIEREEFKKLNKIVTKIQAWWRGTMVRCKLGPYKPKKSKGKSKPKGQKK